MLSEQITPSSQSQREDENQFKYPSASICDIFITIVNITECIGLIFYYFYTKYYYVILITEMYFIKIYYY